MLRRSPREDGRVLLAVLRAAKGTLVPHATLMAALGDRAPRYMEGMMCARTQLWSEATGDTHDYEAGRVNANRLVCVKGKGYLLEKKTP